MDFLLHTGSWFQEDFGEEGKGFTLMGFDKTI